MQRDEPKIILGIWDGHDSGISILSENDILYAANEERFTRRKLEIGFPVKTIENAFDTLDISKDDIDYVAYSTTDLAKTLTRYFPFLKEKYYRIRRKKVYPNLLTSFKKRMKYFLTLQNPNFISSFLSDLYIKRKLRHVGINPRKIYSVNHHEAHIYSGGLCSDFDKCVIFSLDGVGDGLSGMVATYDNGEIDILHKQRAKDSLGIFFEHVTNLLNMRELEDEGKVMALADFSIDVKDNELVDFFRMKNGRLISRYSTSKMYKKLKRILWRYPLEQFAYMAQQALEHMALEYIKYWREKTQQDKVVLTGGVFANIKLNQKVLHQNGVQDIFIFPHMGDGGLAVGAAAHIANNKLKIKKINFDNCFIGTSYKSKEVMEVIKGSGFKYKKVNPAKKGAEIISKGNILFWYQGRMEYGPRALGHRSILCLPGDMNLKDKLNINVKKRVWYQPFCPSMLPEEADRVLKDIKGTKNNYMTCGYYIKDEFKEVMQGVMNVDNSCRPQIVRKQNKTYYDMLKELKKLTGFGIVLNTSFNIHGEPIVNSPSDAIDVFKRTPKVKFLILENYLLEK